MEVDAAGVPPASLDNRGESDVTFTKLENGTFALSELWDDGMQQGVQMAWTALRRAGEPRDDHTRARGAGPAATERR